MTAHSKIGASSMDRWAACPGSVVLSEGIESRSSKYAEEGTAAHALGEWGLNGDGHVHYWLGSEFNYDDHGEAKTIVVDDEMADNVAVYVNYVRELATNGRLHVEHRFDLGKVHEGLFGTSDAVVWLPETRTLHVIDLKYGAGKPVNVHGNPQLRYYAVGALMTLGYNAEKIVITVVQPRCNHPDGPIRTEEISVLDLMNWTADLIDAVKRVEEARSQFAAPADAAWLAEYLSAGDHCRWCPASGLPCPLVASKAQEVAKVVFAPQTPYDPALLAETLEWLPILEAWIKNVREFAYAEAEHGNAIPGHKLVEKRATRKWRDPKEAETVLSDFLEPNKLYSEPELRTVAQIEKELGKGAKDILAQLVVAESSGHTLVHESDKRPAIKVDAKSAFSAAEPKAD